MEEGNNYQPPEQPQEADTIIAPKNPPDSETLPNVAERLQAYQRLVNPLDAKTDQDTHERVEELKAREQQADPNEQPTPATSLRLVALHARYEGEGERGAYTEEEDFYLHNSWKDYIRKYGTEGSFGLEEIARANNLYAGEIKKAIADGTITDPNAIKVYAQLRLEQFKAYNEKILAKFQSDPDLVPEVENLRINNEIALHIAEEECLPLLSGDETVVARYCAQQATYAVDRAQNLEAGITQDNNLTPEQCYAAASRWYEMASRVIAKKAKDKRQTDTDTNNTTPREEK